MKKKDLNPQSITLWRDEGKIQEKRNQLDILLPNIQNVIDKFMKMKLPEVENLSLQNILLDNQILITRHLKSQLPDELNLPGGLKLNKDRTVSMNLIILPGRDEFEVGLSLLNQSDISTAIEYFALKDGIITINDLKFQEFEDKNSIIAKTPEQIELATLWQQMINSMEEFDNFLKMNFRNLFRHKLLIDIPKFFLLDKDHKLIINHRTFYDFVKFYSGGSLTGDIPIPDGSKPFRMSRCPDPKHPESNIVYL